MSDKKRMSDPVTLFRNGESVTVYPIDAGAWRAQGWDEDSETKVPKAKIAQLEKGAAPDSTEESGDGKGTAA